MTKPEPLKDKIIYWSVNDEDIYEITKDIRSAVEYHKYIIMLVEEAWFKYKIDLDEYLYWRMILSYEEAFKNVRVNR